MAGFAVRLRYAWNAFVERDRQDRVHNYDGVSYGASYGTRPHHTRFSFSNERSIISSIYACIGVDVAAIEIRHVRTDGSDRYLEDIDSGLNSCLTLEANVDQAASAFRQDIAMTLFEYGVAAVVPVDTSLNPELSGSFDIKTMRVGHVVAWHPYHVRVSLYNERTGMREELTLLKSVVAIVENPLYSVMNEPNSTLQRLIRKLNLLDAVDDASNSGKLDIIIQLPYVIKSEARRTQAEQRRKDIEFQLKGSQYGIAYTDGTEKVTQLNRPAENNLMGQIEFLTKMLYGQLGITEEVMNGTANEATMLNYMNRTVEPILRAIVEAMRRTFLTKTGRSQKQTLMYFRDPFKLIPIGGEGGIADIADKLCRNEVVTSNEVRQILGIKPSSDPKADQLVNSNMPQTNPADVSNGANVSSDVVPSSPGGDVLASSFDEIDAALDEAFAGLDLNPEVAQ